MPNTSLDRNEAQPGYWNSAGMFLSRGDRRNIYYCSTLTWARIAWS
ncbi:uncharacterized protein METZ01_LOCUS21323 [marine metagenome]|uniref:Uncharacterized protein n=1 Tax=marine metagenome TaxID=408172 RepID=A0A381PR17_9ZZZZ